MNRMVTLRDFLKSYNISKGRFMSEVNKDKEFYDTYIEWEDRDDATIITPKALTKLGEIFNEQEKVTKQSDTEAQMTITVDGEINSVVNMDTVDASKKSKDKEEKEELVNMSDMSEFMEKPIDTEEEQHDEEKTEQKSVKSADTKRKKKSKLNITKQFIQEHGKADMNDSESIKQLRKFLMNDGTHKLEEVALMTDEEVQAAFGKDFYVIKAEEGTYIIKKSAFVEIMSDIFVVGKE